MWKFLNTAALVGGVAVIALAYNGRDEIDSAEATASVNRTATGVPYPMEMVGGTRTDGLAGAMGFEGGIDRAPTTPGAWRVENGAASYRLAGGDPLLTLACAPSGAGVAITRRGPAAASGEGRRFGLFTDRVNVPGQWDVDRNEADQLFTTVSSDSPAWREAVTNKRVGLGTEGLPPLVVPVTDEVAATLSACGVWTTNVEARETTLASSVCPWPAAPEGASIRAECAQLGETMLVATIGGARTLVRFTGGAQQPEPLPEGARLSGEIEWRVHDGQAVSAVLPYEASGERNYAVLKVPAGNEAGCLAELVSEQGESGVLANARISADRRAPEHECSRGMITAALN